MFMFYRLLTGLAGAFNTYVNPLGISAFGWKFYWFYVAWIFIEWVVVYFLFIETKVGIFSLLRITASELHKSN